MWSYMIAFVWLVRFCGSGGAFWSSWWRFWGSDEEDVAANKFGQDLICGSKSLFSWIWVIFMAHVHTRLGNSFWPSPLNVAYNSSKAGSVGEIGSEIQQSRSVCLGLEVAAGLQLNEAASVRIFLIKTRFLYLEMYKSTGIIVVLFRSSTVLLSAQHFKHPVGVFIWLVFNYITVVHNLLFVCLKLYIFFLFRTRGSTGFSRVLQTRFSIVPPSPP